MLPNFQLHVREGRVQPPQPEEPCLGAVKKSQFIRRRSTCSVEEESSIEVVVPQDHSISDILHHIPGISDILHDIEVNARTTVPVTRAIINFLGRSGDGTSFNSTCRIAFRKLSFFFVMDKFGIDS
ncbi:hypothetical protein SAY87_008263 [Trapa incisa]|uniref:Uncharacterized protein n=1 Tax=Trapa incisa TaxID=236973 RepID=A0AAN7QFU7_9MYRT|nr:hypothetical protein SAY87_008263 [Trapa incisa]